MNINGVFPRRKEKSSNPFWKPALWFSSPHQFSAVLKTIYFTSSNLEVNKVVSNMLNFLHDKSKTKEKHTGVLGKIKLIENRKYRMA